VNETPKKEMIEIQDLSYSYKGQEVLTNINLTVKQGDFVAVIGPNGGGKTTLVKLILGLMEPRKGSILVNGRKPGQSGTRIGYVPQHINHNLVFPATAVDVVLMGRHDPGKRWSLLGRDNDRQKALAALEKMGMGALANRKISTLSGGQRQRVLIARALVTEPDLLVLDEPTASIDTKGQTDFYNLLRELNKDLTILVVSHDLMVIASYAKSIACVNKRLHYHDFVGTTADLINAFHSCTVEEICPVETVVRGITPSTFQEISRHD